MSPNITTLPLSSLLWRVEGKQEFIHTFTIPTEHMNCVHHNKLWEILKEMGIVDHLTCLLRNLYAGQEETVRTEHGTTDWFQIGKGVCPGCILSLCLFNLNAVQSTSCEMPGWMNHKLESRFPGEISIPQICRWHYPNGRNWRGSKEPLDEGERGEW